LSYLVVSLHCDSAILRVDALDAIQLALVRAIKYDHAVALSQVQLIRTASPGASLLKNMWPELVHARVTPILSHILLESAVTVESEIALWSQGPKLPVLSPCSPCVSEVFADLFAGQLHVLAILLPRIGRLFLRRRLSPATSLALGLDSSLGQLLHLGGEPKRFEIRIGMKDYVSFHETWSEATPRAT
jgi:hypothetical protein